MCRVRADMKTSIQSLCLASITLIPAVAMGQFGEGRVANGKKALACDAPPVVYVKGCTGTLVHPQVVVYAAHCGKTGSVVFGESKRGKTVKTKKCGTNPKFSWNPPTSQWDWAYCVLAEPVKDVPIVPIAYGCEKELFTKSGQEVLQIGYGETGRKDPGIKYWGMSELSRVSGGTITVSDANGVVACPGDSGGPLMVRAKDGGWRTVGILSTYNGRCGKGGMNTYADIEDALPWLEKESGFDLTPCFDSDGKWEPGPDCGGFYAGTPGSPQGTWGDMCKGTEVSGKSTTCGKNGDEGGEGDKEKDEDKSKDEEKDKSKEGEGEGSTGEDSSEGDSGEGSAGDTTGAEEESSESKEPDESPEPSDQTPDESEKEDSETTGSTPESEAVSPEETEKSKGADDREGDDSGCALGGGARPISLFGMLGLLWGSIRRRK